MFGYGYASLWDEEMQDRFAMRYISEIGYSHNLWYQILGQAGYVGIACLIIFLAFLMIAGFHNVRPYFAVAIVLGFFILRGITEVPLGADVFTENFLIQALILIWLSNQLRTKQQWRT